MSPFRQMATSLERLLTFIRPLLDCDGARDGFSTRCFVPTGETGTAMAGLTSEGLA